MPGGLLAEVGPWVGLLLILLLLSSNTFSGSTTLACPPWYLHPIVCSPRLRGSAVERRRLLRPLVDASSALLTSPFHLSEQRVLRRLSVA